MELVCDNKVPCPGTMTGYNDRPRRRATKAGHAVCRPKSQAFTGNEVHSGEEPQNIEQGTAECRGKGDLNGEVSSLRRSEFLGRHSAVPRYSLSDPCERLPEVSSLSGSSPPGSCWLSDLRSPIVSTRISATVVIVLGGMLVVGCQPSKETTSNPQQSALIPISA
jgi:hypothetical protein